MFRIYFDNYHFPRVVRQCSQFPDDALEDIACMVEWVNAGPHDR